jgi:hypothetical protein
MIDTSPDSIRIFAIIILTLLWIWVFNYPVKDET